MVLFSLMLACASQKTTAADGTKNFYGASPTEKVALPDFKTINYDGSTRGKEDLVGHPTVLWFYPRAGTPG